MCFRVEPNKENINFFLKKRKEIFDEYNQQLSENNADIQMIKYDKDTKPSFHLGLIDLELKKKNKETFIKHLK